MGILARKHPESRFVKVNVEKFPFLVKRLNVHVVPTLALVKDDKTIDYLRGFDEFGRKDDFKTELLEWRIAKGGLIEYSSDLSAPPGKKEEKKPIFGGKSKKIGW